MTFNRRQFTAGAAALAGGFALPHAHAAGYPERDITLIMGYGTGGSLDPMLRQYSKQMEKILGGNMNVESRPGASGTIGLTAIVRAKPDGYTIGYAGGTGLVYQPMVMKGLPWATPDDYQPIVKLNEMPTLLVVRADSPLKSWDDFFRQVKTGPNPMRIGVSGLRTIADLGMQQINRIANVNIRTVPFTGGAGETIVALLGGRLDGILAYTEAIRGHVDSGSMKVIAVFKNEPYESYPNASLVGKSGFPESSLAATSYIVGPKGIPKDILDKLVNASLSVVRSEEFRNFAKPAGMVLDPKGPDAIRAELIAATDKYITINKYLDNVKT